MSPNGGWAAATKDMNQWVQIHLQKVTTVTGVATQGRNSARKEWVTTYKISYSPNGQAWTVYQEDKEDKVLSVCPSVRPFVHLSACQFVCLPANQSVNLRFGSIDVHTQYNNISYLSTIGVQWKQ